MADTYYKTGTDVYKLHENFAPYRLSQQEFQDLGINYNLLGEGTANAKTIDQVRDTETQAYIAAGGTLGTPNAAINAGYTATNSPPSNFTMNLPSLTSASDLDTAFNSAYNNFDVSKLISDYQTRMDDLTAQAMAALQPTAEEKQAQERLMGLQQLQTQAIQQQEERPLEGTVLRASLAQDIQNITTGNTRESLVNLREQTFEQQGLLLQQQQRQQQFDALKFQIDQEGATMDKVFQAVQINEEMKNNYINQVATLNSVARQNLGLLLDNFQGLTFDQLSPETALKIGQLAAQVGIPVEAIKQGMQIQANQIEAANKLDWYNAETSRINANNSGTGGGLDLMGLLSLLGNTTEGQYSDQYAGIINALNLSQPNSQDQKLFNQNVQQYIANNNMEGLKNYLKTATYNTLPVGQKANMQGYDNTIEQLNQIMSGLNEYERLGGDTGLLTGTLEGISNKLGRTTDPALQVAANKIRLAITAYTVAVSGVQFSERERAQYQATFPSIGNQGEVNLAKAQSAIEVLNAQKKNLLSYAVGGGANYDLLFGADQGASDSYVQSILNGDTTGGTSIISPTNFSTSTPSYSTDTGNFWTNFWMDNQ